LVSRFCGKTPRGRRNQTPGNAGNGINNAKKRNNIVATFHENVASTPASNRVQPLPPPGRCVVLRTCSLVRGRFDEDGDTIPNHGWYLSTSREHFFSLRPRFRSLPPVVGRAGENGGEQRETRKGIEVFSVDSFLGAFILKDVSNSGVLLEASKVRGP